MAWSVTGVLALIIAGLTLTEPVSGAGGLNVNDKLAHFLAFAALASPLSFSKPRRAAAVVVGAVLFGALIEVIQPHVGRSAEWADLLADGLGACAGAVLAVWGRHRHLARRAR